VLAALGHPLSPGHPLLPEQSPFHVEELEEEHVLVEPGVGVVGEVGE